MTGQERAGDDPRREAARDTLRSELREVVGESAAAEGERAGALEAAEQAGGSGGVAAALSESRILILATLFVALIAGAVAGLATGQWWWLLIALAIHALGTTVVVATTLRMTASVESPSPTAAAALEEHGVRDPDAALTEAVRVTAEATDSDEAQRASDQQGSITPEGNQTPSEGAK
jgi:membrane protein implicated in regulation of membrane protease activity